MTITGIDHVQVAAPIGGEDDTRRFYGEVLGLVEIEKPDALKERGGVWFAAGMQQLHVGADPQFAPARKAHPAFTVPEGELSELAARLQLTGVPTAWDNESIPGVRRFHAHDPFGNRLEFIGV